MGDLTINQSVIKRNLVIYLSTNQEGNVATVARTYTGVKADAAKEKIYAAAQAIAGLGNSDSFECQVNEKIKLAAEL